MDTQTGADAGTDTGVDAVALERRLRDAVRGDVGFRTRDRALVTMDASNYRGVPLGVVAPRDADDVAAALAVCREYGAPVVARGGGTSIAGNAVGTGVVLDFTRHLNRLVGLDPAARTAVVQPGLVLDRLRSAAAEHGLTFGPDPSTHSRCTIGGMVGNNSCGSHSVAWGTTADNVRALDVVTYRGRALRLERDPGVLPGLEEFVAEHLATLRTGGRTGGSAGGSAGGRTDGPARGGAEGPDAGAVRDGATGALGPYPRDLPGWPDLPRRISGYALDALLPERGADLARAFTGSEGTLAVLTEATVRLVEAPAARALAVLGYADESAAAEAAAGLLPLRPLTVEGMAADLVPDAHALPRGGAWLFVETGGDSPAAARAAADAVCRAADAVDHAVVADPAAQRTLWRIREDASGTATRMRDGSEAWPGWEDCAVPPARLGAYLRDFRALLAAHGLRGLPYGHFGDGCIHVRIDFDLLTAGGVARFREFSGELADLVVAHGGSLSGEHGDGRARSELLPAMYGDELVRLFGGFKDLWDPDGALNPGVIARPAPLDAGLRFAPLPRGPVPVAFGYPHDGPEGGDFAAAVRRCVGVAKCRNPAGSPGVMCPSFRATGEERHSTRGRARLLHEMLAGEVITDGWRSEEVREALDLCLACKGCRSDCPVDVDMATYKAEFLHHHYAGRRRPMAHYAMGRLPQWLRLTAVLRAAGVANALAGVRPLAAVAKRVAGLAGERPIPPIARVPLTRALGRGGDGGARGAGRGTDRDPDVLLWPDTFTNYLSPEAGSAALRVLRAAGLRVGLPRGAGKVCCGLTYVSTGQLDLARKAMRRTLDALEPEGGAGGGGTGGDEAGPPLVVLEPPCAATLRTDLVELLPDDARAPRLAARVRTLAEALETAAPDWTPPRLDRPVTGQTHCHQHAILGDAAERRLMAKAGLDGQLAAGCCGLAGNFGFERGHFEVSAACAEDQLLPAVRSAPENAAVVADGYSCRTQLDQLAGIRARHLAELLAEGLPEEG
ncbi:FAD-binding and (Fe-S)-binding domain-containing protein [Streptomyces sp. WMMC500]|uniref:FAD-binding and (Fe-S)-binding domain-containing protein n=1 Tax=Streptomyces sp. WMMC500 TaxID=3015154 RepID=UPI00248AF9D3|nr:FAD-binding and (Fe-S)-binding domain-containing protein [Streptomyces sp. WMMC500]WBB58602.1 FAD-binding and (Fe-S)-binding domain-containing protein [Streptomyces sp. WMMC500]